ncbi:LysR family transcriptional regulator [Mesorhizobium sp. AR10]|uniref:LysR family transcriptional regulator n=1 Tax=Mesorhizobium sp. AR10 TaxID=2865839 RepID=UPI00215E5579|nr:LysR family transcriptional regulator [Mesorhizobium sp. AR10]UVK36637.1 LysR family transcriptional regulator [Mesorhizobium sp. AR10]
MRSPAIPSIDQLLVLLTVAEAGSFSAAAKRLGRATSAISYAIDTLEEQLGISLFDRGTTRKPKLTQQGEAVVSEARAVAHSVETLRARVRGFLDELEPEVSLVVDSMLPGDRLTTLLREFHAEFPTVPIRLLVQTLGGVERAVRNGHARIGVGSELHMDMTGFRRTDIDSVRIIPVAAPSHPLARASEAAAPSQASDFVQLILSEEPAAESRDFGVVSLNTWRIGDQAARRKLLIAGLGWSGMPEPIVRSDIESGRLVQLNLPDWRGGEYTMQAIHKTDTPPGPAGRWLIEKLVTLSDGVAPLSQEITKPIKAKRATRTAAPKPGS